MLKDKTIFITGASRGIGREIALRCAKDGANIVIAAKTDTKHQKLPGTIFSVAKEIEDLGGNALPIKVDVRNQDDIEYAISELYNKFGGIDICINNASALLMTDTINTDIKKFDLINAVNIRGTFLCSKNCIPYLKKSSNGKILNISPPLNMSAKWFKNHLAYTISKYGMSMCTLGMAEELKQFNIQVNSLWPMTSIATAAIKYNFPKIVYSSSRYPAIMADAAYEILIDNSITGKFCIDEEILRSRGCCNFDKYAVDLNYKLYKDLFL